MEIRFYEDPDTGQPHIYGHGVTEEEVRQVLQGSGEDLPAARDSRMKLGQTASGRYLQVIYVPDGFAHLFAGVPTLGAFWPSFSHYRSTFDSQVAIFSHGTE